MKGLVFGGGVEIRCDGDQQSLNIKMLLVNFMKR